MSLRAKFVALLAMSALSTAFGQDPSPAPADKPTSEGPESAPAPEKAPQADAPTNTQQPQLAPATPETPTTPAPAANVTPPSEEKKPRRAAEEQIVVTGSRIQRKDLTGSAPLTLLSREQFQQSGKMSLGEFLQTLPEQGNAPNFQVNNGGATYGADGSTRINLRNLGVTRTLILVNGRRVVPTGLGASAAIDLNTIPAAAVERIEVLKDGASAIYGSDAIAGVVNIITRRAVNVAELTAQYGTSTRGDAQTFEASGTIGRRTDFGNFLFTATYFTQGASWLRDREWSSKALTYDYTNKKAIAGGSFRTPSGAITIPQNMDGTPKAECLNNDLCRTLVNRTPDWQNEAFIRDPSRPATDPDGWRVFKNEDRYNFAAENYLTIPSDRFQIFSSGDVPFKYSRVYYEASYVQRTSTQNAAPMPFDPGDYGVTLSKDSMYNPFGVDLSTAARRLVEFGHRTYKQELNTFRVVLGVDGHLPTMFGPLADWMWDVSLNYGRTSGTFTTGGAIRNSKVADALGPSKVINEVPRCLKDINDDSSVIPGCVPLNLFGGPNNGSIDPSQINYLGFEGTSRAFDQLLAVNANLTGELFKLFADRATGLAVGYEFRRQIGAQIADPIAASGDSADFNFTSTQGSYNVHEAYAEFSLPVLSNIFLVQDLEATLAGRFVSYNFGSNTSNNFSGKVGARYSPVQDVTLRGTFSTAFRAPTINELYLGQSETAPVATDPCNFDMDSEQELKDQCVATGVPAGGSNDPNRQQLTRVGGNSKLSPETAETFTAGVVIQPRVVKNLSLTFDYYNIHVSNIVGNIGTATILAGCYPGSAGESYQPYCDRILRSPAGRIRYVSDLNDNVGELNTAGFDLAVRYALPTEVAGRFAFNFDTNFLLFLNRKQVTPIGTERVFGVGTYSVLGSLPPVKMNAGINWSHKVGFNIGVNMRYIASFKECGALDSASNTVLSAGGVCSPATPENESREVGANVVFDLYAGYTLTTPVGKSTLRVGLNNVFDQAPQFVYSAPLANSDPSVYDFLGRYFYARLQQTF